METIIRDTDFTRVDGSVKPDTRKRVVLPAALVRKDIIYHTYHNSIGQILLDPQVTIPASELWVFENKDILTSIDKGMAEEQVINLGLFGKYAKDAP